ncbi:MAG TPA: class I SAM-dependent methyltransferase [Sphingomicrobium sp.]|nr:class I SAM-dependent methyltransferase [Sphingomicrobium sp.]
MNLLQDDQSVAPETLLVGAHARLMALEDCVPMLVSPDSRRPLFLEDGCLTDGERSYALREGLPLLFPERLRAFFTDRLAVPFEHSRAQFLQYFLLATIKQSGDVNAPASSLPFHRHLARARDFLQTCRGTLLDVGCDDPALSAALLSPEVSYVGLDPFCARAEPFRVIGVGEFLPFADASFDNVLFNTSLDHIMDWHLAVDEAVRVLRPGGRLVILSYVWTERADLLNDTVHFHHFRDYEVLGKIGEVGLKVEEELRYVCPKDDTHRHELFVRAVRP